MIFDWLSIHLASGQNWTKYLKQSYNQDVWCVTKVMSGGGICTIFAFNDISGPNKQSKYEEYVVLGRSIH